MYNFNDPNEFSKEQLFFTYEEFKQFLSVETDIKWIGIFEILYYCGLRRGELRGLQWKDINFKDRTLITKQINDRCCSIKNWRFSVSKTKSSIRLLKMSQVLTYDLKMMKNEAEKIPGFNDDFFVVSDAKPIADSNIYLRRTKLATLAGLKVIRIHDFRHYCASLLINNGANITLVAKYLGHTKIEETLNTYSHMFSTALDSVVSVIDSLEND